MNEPIIGQPAPDFELPATSGQTIRLSSLHGRPVVIYFYPKDNTPGCTREGQDFRDQHARFESSHAVVLGISRDTLKTHENFKTKYEFPFDLLADTELSACTLYGVYREKNMYGRKVMGIERSTFLIDADGLLRQAWRKVRVPGHIEAVLTALKEL